MLNIIDNLEQKLSSGYYGHETEQIHLELKSANIELELLEQKESLGRYIRSKAYHIEHDQRNSKLFFNIEKQNYNEKTYEN